MKELKTKAKKVKTKAKTRTKMLIDPDALIMDIIEQYPDAAEFLLLEYNFHCINCYFSGFESLRDGAYAHGIVDQDFEEMMKKLNDYIKTKKKKNN
jgi:hybrid cluster-associated redox disulfide protein